MYSVFDWRSINEFGQNQQRRLQYENTSISTMLTDRWNRAMASRRFSTARKWSSMMKSNGVTRVLWAARASLECRFADTTQPAYRPAIGASPATRSRSSKTFGNSQLLERFSANLSLHSHG